jgi:hypothetical protein
MAKPKILNALPTIAMSQLAQYARSHWFVVVPAGVTFDKLLIPSFWAHHQSKFKVHDIVEVVSQDGSFDAELRVTDRDVGFAKMRVLRKWEKEADATISASEQNRQDQQQVPAKKVYPCVDFKQAEQWRVLGFDGNVVKKDLPSKDDAERELAEYNRRAQAA